MYFFKLLHLGIDSHAININHNYKSSKGEKNNFQFLTKLSSTLGGPWAIDKVFSKLIQINKRRRTTFGNGHNIVIKRR